MPDAELQRFATYCRSMATAVAKTIRMARQDLADARAAARQGDIVYPLTPTQVLALKAGLEREHRLWTQLADEIDGYLNAPAPEPVPDADQLQFPEVDL